MLGLFSSSTADDMIDWVVKRITLKVEWPYKESPDETPTFGAVKGKKMEKWAWSTGGVASPCSPVGPAVQRLERRRRGNRRTSWRRPRAAPATAGRRCAASWPASAARKRPTCPVPVEPVSPLTRWVILLNSINISFHWIEKGRRFTSPSLNFEMNIKLCINFNEIKTNR